jgi:iron complex transport system substrate-binding protein
MLRIVSLLPAATEIAAALGLMDQVVGVSHECDHPPAARHKQRVNFCETHEVPLPSNEVDHWVYEVLTSRGTLYTMNEPLLRRLQPNVILMQKLCHVCAVGYDSVARLAATLPGPPTVINLEPSNLKDIFANIQLVADVTGVKPKGRSVIAALQKRVEAVRARIAKANYRPRCSLLEWIEPPYCSGRWGPELAEIAGGDDLLGRKGRDSKRIQWENVLKARPEVLVLACCGYSIQRTLRDVPILQAHPEWNSLPAVQNNQVYAVKGSAYFSRPGPRIVDSLELLAGIVHPDLAAELAPESMGSAWVARVKPAVAT